MSATIKEGSDRTIVNQDKQPALLMYDSTTDKLVHVEVDSSGHLKVVAGDTEGLYINSDTAITVADEDRFKTNSLLEEVLDQLKILNIQMQIVTDNEIEEIERNDN